MPKLKPKFIDHKLSLAQDIGDSLPKPVIPDDSRGPGWKLMCRRPTREETMSSQADRGMAQNSPGFAALIAGHKD